MYAFCKANLSQGESRVMYHTSPSTQNRLYSFYVFTAAVASPNRGDTSYLSKVGEDYGSKFAKFILDNKLGEITESPIRQNQAFHEDHSNRLWIWAPDQKMIEKWWEAEKKSNSSLKAEQEKQLSQIKAKPLPVQHPPVMHVQQIKADFWRNAQANIGKLKPLPNPQPAYGLYAIPEADDYELPDWNDDEDDLPF